jgi:hypothetical protein
MPRLTVREVAGQIETPRRGARRGLRGGNIQFVWEIGWLVIQTVRAAKECRGRELMTFLTLEADWIHKLYRSQQTIDPK